MKASRMTRKPNTSLAIGGGIQPNQGVHRPECHYLKGRRVTFSAIAHHAGVKKSPGNRETKF
jgi:hypothetical protein